MAVKFTVDAVKTAEAKWWEDSHNEEAQQVTVYNRSFPGLITVSVTRYDDNPDRITVHMIFADGVSLSKYFLQAFTNELFISRRRYSFENDITNVSTIEEI